MHRWGDDVDWAGINKAAEFIGTNLRKWGRVNVMQYKEKFGEVRVYCSFGWTQLHNITHPGHAYSRYPGWLWKLDIYYISRLISLLNCIVVPYHIWLYKLLYRKAIKRWPHLRLEILSGADHSHLLGEHGVHVIRTSENGCQIMIDWHPDNFQSKREDDEAESSDR
jgi:hypothetical protein